MPKEKGVSALSGIAIILAVALVAFGGVFAYQYLVTKTQPVVQTQQNQNTENKAPIIEGISIEKPNLVVTGQNLSKVQIYFVPTGTEIDPETMSRIENAIKQSESNGEQVWTYRYPSDLLITNIFAKGFDDKGNFVKEVDLPIVGATALAEALYGNATDQTAGWKTYTNTQYGFEIQYPNSMSVQNSTNGVSLVSTDNQRKVDIKVESIEPGQDCRKTAWVADTPNKTIDNTIFVGVGSGLKDEPYYGVMYCAIRNGFDYMITSHLFHVSGGPNNFPENDNALNQILSTFKFTK